MLHSQPSAQSVEAALALLERIIAVPSHSREEARLADLLTDELNALDLAPQRRGKNILCRIERAAGPRLMLCSHFDTVPPAAGYTRDPYKPERKNQRLYGLGANDAGAAIVSMIHAMAALKAEPDWTGTLELALVAEEEVSGRDGIEALLAEIGLPDAAIVGEPTGLDVCVAQKGLLVLNCVNHGAACHAANAWRLPHRNAILEATADIQAVSALAFPERDSALGPTTLNVTIIGAGKAHNTIPDRCEWTVDIRVNPAQKLEEVVETVRGIVRAEVAPRSLRLPAYRIDPEAAIVKAALAARPEAKTFGSDTMSDAVFLRETAVIKVGPGVTELSHQPDEYVETRWIEEGIRFYRAAPLNYFGLHDAQGPAPRAS